MAQNLCCAIEVLKIITEAGHFGKVFYLLVHDNCMSKDFMNNFEKDRRGRLRHIGPKPMGGTLWKKRKHPNVEANGPMSRKETRAMGFRLRRKAEQPRGKVAAVTQRPTRIRRTH